MKQENISNCFVKTFPLFPDKSIEKNEEPISVSESPFFNKTINLHKGCNTIFFLSYCGITFRIPWEHQQYLVENPAKLSTKRNIQPSLLSLLTLNVIDSLFIHERFLGIFMIEHRNGNTPCPLPGNTPICATRSHSRNSVLCLNETIH